MSYIPNLPQGSTFTPLSSSITFVLEFWWVLDKFPIVKIQPQLLGVKNVFSSLSPFLKLLYLFYYFPRYYYFISCTRCLAGGIRSPGTRVIDGGEPSVWTLGTELWFSRRSSQRHDMASLPYLCSFLSSFFLSFFSRLTWNVLCSPCWLHIHGDPPASASLSIGVKYHIGQVVWIQTPPCHFTCK